VSKHKICAPRKKAIWKTRSEISTRGYLTYKDKVLELAIEKARFGNKMPITTTPTQLQF